MAHQVEAEAVDLVLLRPGDERVDHQLLHHRVLGRGVGAAGRGLDRAVRIEPLVVAGNDAVEDRVVGLAGRRRVVVDDVHHDAQAGPVERADHPAELAGALRALGIGGVGALRGRVVQRVVAPVEPVGVRHRGDAGLLLRRCRAGGSPASQAGVCCAARSSSMVAMSNAGSRCTVFSPALASWRRCRMPAPCRSVNARYVPRRSLCTVGVADREVADVQLVDRRVLGLVERRLLQVVPAVRGEPGRREIGDDGGVRVGGQRHAVRVGDDVLLDRVRRRHVHLDLVGVGAVHPAGATPAGPHAVAVPAHRVLGRWRVAGRVDDAA